MGQYKIYYTTTNTSTDPFFWSYPYSAQYAPFFLNNSSPNLYNIVEEAFYNSGYKIKPVPDKATKVMEVE